MRPAPFSPTRTVTAINEETGVTRVVRTNGRGQFQDPERGPLVRRAFEDLATGRYTKQEGLFRT